MYIFKPRNPQLKCVVTLSKGTTLGTRTHEKVGELFLKNLGFPESVTSFVRGHVEAKRYLVYR